MGESTHGHVWEGQYGSLLRRMRELEENSRAAAENLIATAHERRSSGASSLEAEARRLQAEAERLAVEEALVGEDASREDLERHLRAIEGQMEEVQTAREEWDRESLAGRRRRRDDRRQFVRLREENERLTAELLRCAALLCRDPEVSAEPCMRRVWQKLRLAGTGR